MKSCSSARILERIAERLFGQWLAVLAADEGQFSGRPSIERLLQDRQDRNADDHGLGAGAGSIVTYYNTTREQRAIRAVWRAMDVYGLELCVRKAINEGQYGKTRYSDYQRPSERFVSDERILGDYSWALGMIKAYIKRNRLPDPATLAALTIICVEFLGLQPIDAFYALLGATSRHQIVDSLIEWKAALKADA
jgi:hypothetical protein